MQRRGWQIAAPYARGRGGAAVGWALRALVLLAVAATTVTAQVPPRDDPSGASIEFDEDPESVVLSFVESPGELDESAGGPTLRVHADGRVVVERPAYMRSAGTRTMKLDRAELRGLLRRMVDRGIADFDPRATRRAMRSARAARRGDASGGSDSGRMAAPAAAPGSDVVLTYRSDEPWTRLELRLRGFRRATEPAGERADLHKRISWRGLQRDAERHPEVEALRGLAAAREELIGVMSHSDLRRGD